MTEPGHNEAPARGKKQAASNDKQPREATVWIGIREDGKHWEFGSELAARRFAMVGAKATVEEHTLGKPPE